MRPRDIPNTVLSLRRQPQIIPSLSDYDNLAFNNGLTTPVNLLFLKFAIAKRRRSIPIRDKPVQRFRRGSGNAKSAFMIGLLQTVESFQDFSPTAKLRFFRDMFNTGVIETGQQNLHSRQVLYDLSI